MNVKIHPWLARIIGASLILAALLGLLLSAAGIVLVWGVRQPVTDRILEGIAIAQTTLITAQEGLDLAEDALETAASSVITMEEALNGVAASIDETSPILASVGDIVSTDLPTTILSTRTSLEAAKSSALLIDNILTTLSSIPFIPIEPYTPSVPLSQALEKVATDLEKIPQSMATIDDSLSKTRQNFIFLRAQILDLSANAREFSESLEEAQGVVDSYQEITQDFLERLENIEDRVATWITISAWILTLFFVWLGIIQVAFILQGWSLIKGEENTQDETTAPEVEAP